MRKLPTPPRPDVARCRLFRDRWLANLGVDAVAVLAFLALAAGRRGVSFYARDRMAIELDIDLPRLDSALHRLQDAGPLRTARGGAVVVTASGSCSMCLSRSPFLCGHVARPPAATSSRTSGSSHLDRIASHDRILALSDDRQQQVLDLRAHLKSGCWDVMWPALKTAAMAA